MGCAGFVIAIGLFVIDIALILLAFGLYKPIYEMTSDSEDVDTHMEYSFWGAEFGYKDEKISVDFDEAPLYHLKDSHRYANIDFACVILIITGLSICGVIIIMGFLDCCAIIDLEAGWTFVCLVLLTIILLGCSVTPPLIATLDCDSEMKKFNKIDTRNDSYFYQAFYVVVNSTESDRYFSASDRVVIKRELLSPDLKMDYGWVLYVLWIAALAVVAALLTFALSRICSKGTERRRGPTSTNRSRDQ